MYVFKEIDRNYDEAATETYELTMVIDSLIIKRIFILTMVMRFRFLDF